MLIISFFIIHFLIVGAVIVAYRKQLINLNYLLLMMLAILPLVGALAVFIFNREKRLRETAPEEDFETRFPWLADTVNLEEPKATVSNMDPKHIVPFQEALLINNMRIRRELIIDVIFESPDQYVKLLHQARLNEDVEVVHYATTILSELSAKYDGRLQKLEEAIANNPKDDELKIAYAQFLHTYIKNDIAEGHHAKSLKESYAKTVQELLDKGLLKNLDAYAHLAQVYTDLGEVDKLKPHLEKMEVAFPEEELTWMAKLEDIILRKSGQDLADLLKDIKEKEIYISGQNRQRLAFWQQKYN